MKIFDDVFGFIHGNTAFFIYHVRHLFLSAETYQLVRNLCLMDILYEKRDTESVCFFQGFPTERARRIHIERNHLCIVYEKKVARQEKLLSNFPYRATDV